MILITVSVNTNRIFEMFVHQHIRPQCMLAFGNVRDISYYNVMRLPDFVMKVTLYFTIAINVKVNHHLQELN